MNRQAQRRRAIPAPGQVRERARFPALLGIIMLVAIASVLLGSCGPREEPKKEPGTKTDREPTIAIKSPKEGEQLAGDTIIVELEVADFKLVTPPKKNKIGEGHVHVTLEPRDQQSRSLGSFRLTHAGEEHESEVEEERHLEEPITIQAAQSQVQFSEIPHGNYRVTVDLVNNDHTDLDPPVRTKVSFSTGPPASQPGTPTPPATGSSDYGR